MKVQDGDQNGGSLEEDIQLIVQFREFNVDTAAELTNSIKTTLQSLLSDQIATIEETPRDNSKDLLINEEIAIKIFTQFSQTEVAIVSRNYKSESSVPTIYIGNNLPGRQYDQWRHIQSKYSGSNSISSCSFVTFTTEESQKEVSRNPSLEQEYNKIFLYMFVSAIVLTLSFIAWYIFTVGVPAIPAPYW
ncbi:hypothetical protein ACFQDG_09225 [Natronoarchaeum mannanilyticum]|uniref:Uncharacterized protein n=1 Tax=Natronoarchaeum mannanilyticum TaxID=926360 RepID=A0AAV3T590_9EURY